MWVNAPDGDPHWTGLYGITSDRKEPRCVEIADEAIAHINARMKCTQAARIDGKIVVTVGLLSDSEPSEALLKRAYGLLVSALEIAKKGVKERL